MNRIQFPSLDTVLCLGAHADDIEIGCGATMLRLVREAPQAKIFWVVFAAHGEREHEARRAAAAFLDGATDPEVITHTFRDGYFPYVGADVKDAFEALKARVQPDLILTHHGEDQHQDHRVVSELTWNTFRDHPILEYEIPKWDGGLGSPSLFVAVEEDDVKTKIRHLHTHYPSQAKRAWFDEDTFRGLMRLRGLECNAPSRFAEGFYARKLLF